jgi:hypothetical protein
MKELLALTGEPWLPAAEKLSANPALRELSAKELYNVRSCNHLI